MTASGPDDREQQEPSQQSPSAVPAVMPSVRKNVLANLAGNAWASAMMLVFVPFYISIMGVESYGVIGIYISLQSIFFAFDLGLPQALNRELAHQSGQQSPGKRMADTVRTLEVLYWATGLLMAATVLAASRFLACHWVNLETLSPEALVNAIRIMAVLLCVKWPISLYTGGLNGLQRQVAVNIITGIAATLQGFGAIAVLWWIDPTVQAFLLWQAFVALLQAVALRTVLVQAVYSGARGQFMTSVLRRMWRFAAGLTAVSLAGMALTQIDKILLSRLLTLSDFGIYTFATGVAAVLYRLIVPVFTSYYPRFTRLTAGGSLQDMARTYHQACQMIAVLIAPAAITGAVFSREILVLWTSGRQLNSEAAIIMSLLLAGNLFHGLAHIPYALQLANGWTRLSFYANCLGLGIAVPGLYLAVVHSGAIGAAACWSGIALLLLTFSVVGMHTRLLPAERNRWFLQDVAVPLVAVVIVTASGRLLLDAVHGSRMLTAAIILFTLATGYAAAVLTCPEVRITVFSILHRLRERLAATHRLHQQEA